LIKALIRLTRSCESENVRKFYPPGLNNSVHLLLIGLVSELQQMNSFERDFFLQKVKQTKGFRDRRVSQGKEQNENISENVESMKAKKT